MSRTITLSRRDLYEEVWSVPMMKLATRYGLSGAGLAKICRKHNIPRPPRGYWARIKFGQKPPKAQLPAVKAEENIHLRNPELIPAEAETVKGAVEELIEAERSPENRVVVVETLRGAHPIVRSAHEVLMASLPDENGLLSTTVDQGLGIKVSKNSLPRALRVLDALAKALECRGYGVSAGTTGVGVDLNGADLTFSILEQLEVKKEQPRHHPLDGHYSFGHSRFDERRVPSGELTLQLHDVGFWASGLQKTWRGTQNRRLEDRLNAFIAGLIKCAARKKQHRIAEERRERQRQERKRRQQEEAQRLNERRDAIAKNKQRVEALLRDAEQWQESQRLRQYIEARKQDHVRQHGEIDATGEFAAWVTWANVQADRLDPLVESSPTIVDEEDELKKEIEEHNARYRYC